MRIIEQGPLMYFCMNFPSVMRKECVAWKAEIKRKYKKGILLLTLSDSHNEHSSAIDRRGPTSLHNPKMI